MSWGVRMVLFTPLRAWIVSYMLYRLWRMDVMVVGTCIDQVVYFQLMGLGVSGCSGTGDIQWI